MIATDSRPAFHNSATIEPGQSARLTATLTKQDGSAPSKNVTVNISLKVDATCGGLAHGNSPC